MRDYRVSGHCSLVSRAFGAKKIIVCGTKEENILNTIKGVNETWGGTFKVEFSESWKKTTEKLKKEGYKIVHLTMYGMPTQEAEGQLTNEKKIAIIIGSQKVEREVYNTADYNLAVTSQPHSEIAALAVFMDRIQNGKELEMDYKDAKCQIIPQEKGKKVINLKTLS